MFAKNHQFFFITGCSYKIEVDCTECNKGAHKVQKPYYQFYYAQAGTVGGKIHYESGDGKYVIWYNNNSGYDGWQIGSTRNLGTNVRGAWVSSDDDCPYQAGYTWRYYNDDAATWYDAEKTMSIWSRSRR